MQSPNQFAQDSKGQQWPQRRQEHTTLSKVTTLLDEAESTSETVRIETPYCSTWKVHL